MRHIQKIPQFVITITVINALLFFAVNSAFTAAQPDLNQHSQNKKVLTSTQSFQSYLPIIMRECAPVICALSTHRYWITFAPPRPFNPGIPIYPTEQQLRTSLQQLYDEGWRGIVTYSLDSTLAEVPRIAKEVGFLYVIAGLFWFDDAQLAREHTEALQKVAWIDAFVVGNEGLQFNRYDLSELEQEMNTLRTATNRPVTTSEITNQYIISPTLFTLGDWLFPNIHPWNAGIRVITDAVQYVQTNNQTLQSQTSKILVVKEAWWPTSGGDPAATESNQTEFFRQLAGTGVKFVWGEAFDQYWKNEAQPPKPDPGPHWGFHTDYGIPRQIIIDLQNIYTGGY